MGSGHSDMDQSPYRSPLRRGHDMGCQLLSRTYEEDDRHSALPCRLWTWQHPFAAAIPGTV